MTPKAIASVRHLVSLLEQNQDRVVIDADTHATDLETLGDAARERYRSEPGYYHGRPVSAEGSGASSSRPRDRLSSAL